MSTPLDPHEPPDPRVGESTGAPPAEPSAGASASEPSRRAGAGEPSLRASARRGGRWGLLSALAQQVGSVLATLVLARELTRSDFGIVAVTYTVVILLFTLTDAGLSAGLVARPDVSRRVASSTFWLAGGLGLVAAGVTIALAGVVTDLLGVPAARPYVIVASAIIPLNLTLSVVRGLALRGLRFRLVYGAEIAGAVVYTVLQITLALTTGLGAWVVVIGWLAMSLTSGTILVVGSRFVPSFEFDRHELRRDLRFNAGYLGTITTNYASKNADNWIVGRSLGAGALGSYYVAYVLPNIIRQRMTWVGSQVVFPVLAKARSEDRLRRAFVELCQVVCFLAIPVLLGLAAVAEPLVRVFFGPQWGSAVAPMRILAVAATLEVVTALTVPVFLARGASGATFRVNVIRLVALAAGLALVVVSDASLRRIAFAVLGATAIALILSLVLLRRLVGLELARLGIALVPVLLSTAVMLTAVVGAARVLPASIPPIGELAVLVGVGGAIYLAVGWLCFRASFRRLLGEARQFVRG